LRQPRSQRPTGLLDWDATDESDIAVALVRTAFILAFALTPYALRIPLQEATFVQLMLVVAATFNLALFAFYLRGRRLPLRRQLALLVDLSLTTAAISSFEDIPYQRDWMVAMYYLIIVVAAIWFRRTGALITAVIAAVMYGVICEHLTFGPELLIGGQTPVLILMAVTASYVVLARDRERAYSTRLSHEMALARHLQQSMLPATVPSPDGFEIGVSFRPARMVGGDLYDIATLHKDAVLVCLGDMAGKSVYGLFHLSLVHSHLHAASRTATEPAEIADLINSNVYDTLQPDAYAALFIGVINTTAQTLTFTNCGHLPPYLLRADGETVELSTGGIVIGAKRQPRYQQRIVPFAPGDVLLCYTDGIEEARDRSGEEFGTDRVISNARANAAKPAQSIANDLMEASARFSLTADEDDRTVLVVKALGKDLSAPADLPGS